MSFKLWLCGCVAVTRTSLNTTQNTTQKDKPRTPWQAAVLVNDGTRQPFTTVAVRVRVCTPRPQAAEHVLQSDHAVTAHVGAMPHVLPLHPLLHTQP